MSIIGRFDVARNGKQIAQLEPRMNQYQMMREPIGTPDVHTTAAGDFYISLSNIDPVGADREHQRLSPRRWWSGSGSP